MEPLVVLSLFDGAGCGYEALKRAGIPVRKYYASEIDKYAIQIAKKNHPDIIHLGDVELWDFWNIEKPDLIIGGSPCQGFSFAGKQLAFDDPRSRLFFTMMDIIKYYKPRHRFLENTKMKKESLDVISDYMGLEPMLINSALVCAQNRNRYYWFNWKAEQPKDRGIALKDILETSPQFEKHILSEAAMNRMERKSYSKPKILPEKTGTINTKNNSGQLSMDSGTTLIPLSAKELEYINRKNQGQLIKIANVNPSGKGMNGWVYDINGKAPTVTTNKGEGSKISKSNQVNPSKKCCGIQPYMQDRVYHVGGKMACLTAAFGSRQRIGTKYNATWRKLTPIECERLQTLPDNYTDGVSNSQRYKMLGNGWNIETIAHIFKTMV